MLLSKSSEQKRETLSVLPILPKEFTSLVSFFLPVSTKLCVCAKSLQSRPTLVTLCTTGPRLLCTRDSPARILEWVAIPFSRGSSRFRNRIHLLHLLHWQMGFFVFFFFFNHQHHLGSPVQSCTTKYFISTIFQNTWVLLSIEGTHTACLSLNCYNKIP